jgi:hypothetical protein
MPSQPKPTKKNQTLKEIIRASREAAEAKEQQWRLEWGLDVPDPVEQGFGHDVTQANPCNTGKLGDFQPRKRDPSLPSIPPTPTGIIDTIGAMIHVRPAKREVERLKNLKGWSVTTRDAGTLKDSAGFTKKLKAKLSLRREIDDLRVWIYDDGIRVEASIPRLLGLTNDKQARLTEDQAIDAFESITSKLFPLTTARVRVDGPTSGWRVTRLDLAKNFKANLSELIEDARFVRHPDIRADPETHGQKGLTIFGENYAVCLYGIREKMGRSVVGATLKGKQFDGDGASLVRFEFRFRSPLALDRMSKDLPLSDRGLPFLVTCRDGERRIFRLGFTNHLLQQILAREARNLGSMTSRQVEGSEKWKPLYRLGVMYLAEQPWAWSLVKGNYGERRIRELKQAVAGIRVSTRKTNFVRLIWSAPQLPPSARALLVERLEHIRAQMTA